MTDTLLPQPGFDESLLAFANTWIDEHMIGSVDHHATESAIRHLYKSIGMASPEIVWCDSPVNALALRSFYETLSLTKTPRSSIRNTLVDLIFLRLFTYINEWMKALTIYFLDGDKEWPKIRSEPYVCSNVLRMRYSPDFLNVWDDLLDGSREDVRNGLWKSLHALGFDRDAPHLHEFRKIIDEDVSDVRTTEQRCFDQVADKQSDTDSSWDEIFLTLRSHMKPRRWKALWNVLQRRRQHALKQVIRQHSAKAGSRHDAKHVYATLVESLEETKLKRIVRRLLQTYLLPMEAMHPNAFEVWYPVDMERFLRMYSFNLWYAFMRREYGLPAHPLLDALHSALGSGGVIFPHRTFCIVCERPHVCHIDDAGRLHSESGPALSYPKSAVEIYAWHGVSTEAYVILFPGSISLADIDGEYNIERRYVKIARYGVERYLRDSGAEMLQRDASGVLWSIHNPSTVDRTPILLLEVQNASPEPDGSRKRYFLRVPPSMRTAKEAVAWTFGKSEEEYSPTIET